MHWTDSAFVWTLSCLFRLWIPRTMSWALREFSVAGLVTPGNLSTQRYSPASVSCVNLMLRSRVTCVALFTAATLNLCWNVLTTLSSPETRLFPQSPKLVLLVTQRLLYQYICDLVALVLQWRVTSEPCTTAVFNGRWTRLDSLPVVTHRQRVSITCRALLFFYITPWNMGRFW